MTKSPKDKKGRSLKPNESQMPDGRYRYRYTDAYGTRHAIYSWKLIPMDKLPPGKKEDISLREKIKNLEADLRDNIKTTQACMTTNQLITSYLQTKSRLANATKENYYNMWKVNIQNSDIGNMPISNVKKSDILKLYAYLYTEKNFSINTLQLYQNLLYPAFQLAVDDSLIRLNPCKNCMKEYSRGSVSSSKVPLSREEQYCFLNFVKNNPIYSVYYPLFIFLLGTGCRISEALGITWKDIDFDNKQISINHQIIYKKKDGRCQFYASPPKTKRSRIIPLQESVLEVLKQYYVDNYIISKYSCLEIDGYSEFVFLNREFHLHKQETINRVLNNIVTSYNRQEQEQAILEERPPIELPHISPHLLRHTYCTRMAENGIDIKVLQEIMGHVNIAITMQVYNHVDNNRVQKEIEKMDDVICI